MKTVYYMNFNLKNYRFMYTLTLHEYSFKGIYILNKTMNFIFIKLKTFIFNLKKMHYKLCFVSTLYKLCCKVEFLYMLYTFIKCIIYVTYKRLYLLLFLKK
ncbi:hypothetical protein H312_01632 [Anncaliia algerae PRA339]|uniref:Uncharacterized protein n=1 Tax=Anncaliia algerae PRA339 TaxID=1288291 RepID=A0A059F1A2_9MICR|nr:hypothetical protein H312_01632 [Anncaliia algerae PRA339]